MSKMWDKWKCLSFSKKHLIINVIIVVLFTISCMVLNSKGIVLQSEIPIGVYAWFGASGGYMAWVKETKVKKQNQA